MTSSTVGSARRCAPAVCGFAAVVGSAAPPALLLLLAIVLPGCPGSAGGADRADPPVALAETMVGMFAEGFALPDEDDYAAYWYARAPEADPIASANLIVWGTVGAVTVVADATRPLLDGRGRGWPTHVGFRVARVVKGTEAHEGRVLSLTYLTPEHGDLGGLGPPPHTLGTGRVYLLFLNPATAGGAMAYDPDTDPPPVPLSMIDAAVHADGTPAEMMTALMVSSLRAPGGGLQRYAVPLLAYLARFHGQETARAELLKLAEGDDAALARSAIKALTKWQPVAEEVADLVKRQSRNQRPGISGLALAARLRAEGANLLPEVIAWLRGPGVTDEDAAPIAGAIRTLGPDEVTEQSLPHFDQLVEDNVPVAIRAGAIQVLWDAGGVEVVPLFMKAINDPDPDVAYVAMLGLCSATDGGIEAGQRGADVRVHLELLPGPVSPDEFRADPQRIAGLWNKWWAQASQDGWPPPPPPEAPAPPVQGPPPG